MWLKIIVLLTLVNIQLLCMATEAQLPRTEWVDGQPVALMTPADFLSPTDDLFGPSYYSWPLKAHAPHAAYNITYIIYRDANIDKIKKQYKIIPEQELDYRYIPYHEAIRYLDKNVAEIKAWMSKHRAKEISYEKSDRICISRDYKDSYDMLLNYYETALYLSKHLSIDAKP